MIGRALSHTELYCGLEGSKRPDLIIEFNRGFFQTQLRGGRQVHACQGRACDRGQLGEPRPAQD